MSKYFILLTPLLFQFMKPEVDLKICIWMGIKCEIKVKVVNSDQF